MKKVFIILLCVTASVALSAQVKTSYFVRNSTLNHNFNAAFAPDQGYFGIPFLTNINVGTNGNIALSDILYPLDNGKLGLFLHPDVPADQALSGFSDINTLGANLQYDLINAGWFTGKDSFWTLSLGLNVDAGAGVPYDLFKVLKVGMESDPSSYSMSGLGLQASAYANLSLGYSRGLDNLVKGLRIGGKVKFLASLMEAYLNVDKLDLTMSSDSWTVATKASGAIYGGGLDFDYDENGNISNMYLDPSQLGLGGIGGAIDLGVEYVLSEGTPLDGLRFALSVADLGFIHYSKDKVTFIESDEGSFVYDGFQNIGQDSDLSDQLSALQDDLFSMLSLKDYKADDNQIKMLTTKLYASVDYSFMKDKMNVGLLYSAKFGQLFDEHELTFAWNYAPARWFDIALSYSMLNTRSTFGWLLTFVPRKGINFFIGSDYTAFNYSSVGIPVDGSYMNVNLGIGVPLGGKNQRY